MDNAPAPSRTRQILHGADYNPDQWLNYPGIIDEDFQLLPLARLNSVSLGIFSWAALEPEEGVFQFDWMDDIFARAEKQDINIVLATPSGGKPNWLAERYPEIRRVTRDGVHEPWWRRHNHCLTSPVYRQKVREINGRLAERYGRRPALVLWHISNEYSGYCYCPLCLEGFRQWLRQRYGSVDALNEAHWSRFWSHTYTSWDQITSVDSGSHGMELDWKRFMTRQCCTFVRNEVEAVRPHSPGVPTTTNMMGFADSYNYWEIAKEIDVVSWDSYPQWHAASPIFDETDSGIFGGLVNDVMRSMKGGKPFLLIETTPSQINWAPVSPLRRPGVNRLNAIQAIAHGSDAVCYFQFRKSRGSWEKFHGAVVDHGGRENTRVFREVAALGETLGRISGVVGTRVAAKTAIIFDWENRWALEEAQCPQNKHKEHIQTVVEHYRPLWTRGVAVDVVDEETDLSPYALVIAPMLYMVRGDLGQRLTAFVKNGGTLVGTYFSGLVDANDLCFLGGFPGPLREVFGILVEESDALADGIVRHVETVDGGGNGLRGVYEARHYLDLIHLEGAEALARYADDFYAGVPAVTLNRFGSGRAYYTASRNDRRFLDDLVGFLVQDIGLAEPLVDKLPAGVTIHRRGEGKDVFYFLLNFRAEPAEVKLNAADLRDAETGTPVGGTVALEPFGSRILR